MTTALGRFACFFLAALGATGCATSTWYGYSFTPAPEEVRIVDERVPESQARALVTLAGIRRPKDGAPARVEVRMRLQNLGAVPFVLRREGLELVAADLTSFEPASVVLEEPLELQPAETVVLASLFELAPDKGPEDYNFDGAAFFWQLDFGAGPIATSVNFQRTWTYRDVPYYRSQVGFGFGYGHGWPCSCGFCAW